MILVISKIADLTMPALKKTSDCIIRLIIGTLVAIVATLFRDVQLGPGPAQITGMQVNLVRAGCLLVRTSRNPMETDLMDWSLAEL
mmetsp:Transcript_79351/g.212760  ORF Transcript_79351/g.212760 Transcript_79351/m.212760 type:complete len:86 (+) Transcript_79351:69-326(+)